MTLVILRDVAQEVGVFVSAVSLVLIDRGDGRVNAQAAERIRAVDDELGYVPKLLARGLKTKQSLTIGLLSDQVASIPFAGPMLAGAQAAAAEHGYLLMLIDTGGDRGLETPVVKAFLQRNIEGPIVATDYHGTVSLPRVPRTLPATAEAGRRSTGGAADARRLPLAHLGSGVLPGKAPGEGAADRHVGPRRAVRTQRRHLLGGVLVSACRQRLDPVSGGRPGALAALRDGGSRPVPDRAPVSGRRRRALTGESVRYSRIGNRVTAVVGQLGTRSSSQPGDSDFSMDQDKLLA